MRAVLQEKDMNPEASQFVNGYHRELVDTVQKAVQENEWVIVGMSANVFVRKARKHLSAHGLKFSYFEEGGYLSKWKNRLAIKLWSGWPTFPQVFHKGKLVGGYRELKKYLP